MMQVKCGICRQMFELPEGSTPATAPDWDYCDACVKGVQETGIGYQKRMVDGEVLQLPNTVWSEYLYITPAVNDELLKPTLRERFCTWLQSMWYKVTRPLHWFGPCNHDEDDEDDDDI